MIGFVFPDSLLPGVGRKENQYVGELVTDHINRSAPKKRKGSEPYSLPFAKFLGLT